MTLQNNELPVLKHLQELRSRLLICFFVWIVGFLISLYFSHLIWFFVSLPIKEISSLELINFTPAEAIQVDFKMASIAAFILAAPFCFYQFYAFCAEALYSTEKKVILSLTIASTLFFLFGILFSFFIALPLLFHFLAEYNTHAKALWSQSAYISFLIRLELAFGLLFQMPVVAAFLSYSKIISSTFFIKHFRITIFTLAFISAIITPPDLFSMILMMGPMLLLYLITIIVNRLFGKEA